MFRPLVMMTTLALAATSTAQPAAPDRLQRLMAGNARYLSGQSSHLNQHRARRSEVAKG